MKPTWILVADSSRARFFVANSRTELQDIGELLHPEGRLHEHDMASDEPGRIASASGEHSYQKHISPKEQEVINFAKSIASYVEEALNAYKFEQLMIIAEPKFLGNLRKQLPDKIQNTVSFELDKNITMLSKEEIIKYLPKRLISSALL
ncbi:MAG: host attachment protein [Methylococcaceae bacterium]|nr:host attachment protein [Methylococcaceae bacterium]